MKTKALIGASILLAFGTAASAQQNGLVNINLGDISVAERAEIAKDINLNVSQIPVTLQVPVSVAAAICNVPVSVLARTKNKGDAACSPTAGSTALNQAILKQQSKQR